MPLTNGTKDGGRGSRIKTAHALQGVPLLQTGGPQGSRRRGPAAGPVVTSCRLRAWTLGGPGCSFTLHFSASSKSFSQEASITSMIKNEKFSSAYLRELVIERTPGASYCIKQTNNT